MGADLGPMPEPAVHGYDVPETPIPVSDGLFAADQMRAYAAAEVAKERERLAEKWITAHGFDRMGVADWIQKEKGE